MANITVYGAPWCPDCRRSKQFLSEQRIRYDWVDIDQDTKAADEVRARNDGKQIIPTIVFEDDTFLVEPSNAELAEKLGLDIAASKTFYDLIILGGGPAGLTAAIYAAREGIDCLVIERSALGGQAGTTEQIDNYPGFPAGIAGEALAQRMIEQAQRYEVEMLSAVSAKSITRDSDCIYVTTEQSDEYRAHAVIVATGSSYRKLGVPGEDDLIGAGIHFCATCDGPFYKGSEELMVIGGGNSGAEEGLFLTQFTKKVRLVEFEDKLKASSSLQDKITNHSQFEIHTGSAVTEFRKDKGGKLGSVVVQDRATGEEKEFKPAAAFVFVGLDPNTGFLKGNLDLDKYGFVETDERYMTSIAGVFAAGDVRAGSTKQLASATGEGAANLLVARKYLEALGEIHVHSSG